MARFCKCLYIYTYVTVLYMCDTDVCLWQPMSYRKNVYLCRFEKIDYATTRVYTTKKTALSDMGLMEWHFYHSIIGLISIRAIHIYSRIEATTNLCYNTGSVEGVVP